MKLVGTKSTQLRVLAYTNIFVGWFIIAHLDERKRKAKAVSFDSIMVIGERDKANCRDLDPAAAAPHDYVGIDLFRCRLCLTPPTHPLHTIRVDSDAG